MRFTVHRRRGAVVVLGALAALVAIETFALHLIVHAHAPALAWALTATSIATIAWMIADAIAIARGGVEVAPGGLDVRVGQRARVRIAWRAIARVERHEGRLARAPGLIRAGVLGTDVIVHLRAPIVVRGPLGVRRRGDRLALAIDDVDGFVGACAAAA